MLTIAKVRKMAEEKGKRLIYNRCTGMYQITCGFESSEGEIPWRNEKGRPGLDESQLKKLASYL